MTSLTAAFRGYSPTERWLGAASLGMLVVMVNILWRGIASAPTPLPTGPQSNEIWAQPVALKQTETDNAQITDSLRVDSLARAQADSLHNAEEARWRELPLLQADRQLLAEGRNQALGGKWLFYPRQLLTPGQIRQRGNQGAAPVTVPHNWEGMEWQGMVLPTHSYGTYAVRLQLPAGVDPLGLELPLIWTSHRAWLNDQLVSEAGQPDSSRERTRSKMVSPLVPLPGQPGEYLLVVQVADFSLFLGGLAEEPMLGNLRQLNENRERQSWFNLLLIGGLFLMGVYHLLIYFYRRKERSMLYFGLISLVVAARFANFGPHSLYLYINEYTSWHNFAVQVKTYYATTFLLVPLGLFYLHSLFPAEAHLRWIQGFAVVMAIYLLVALSLPVHLFSQTVDISQLFLIVGALYLVFIIVWATVRRRPYARFVFAGLLMMALAGVHDALQLVGLHLVTRFELLTFGFLSFLFVQFVTLSRRYSTAFNEIEDLSVNLELKVRQRTAELEDANAEIQHRNQTLQAANVQIEKQSLELKQKNQDITDSIEYARRIQLSILPRVDVLNPIFPDNFVYYRPKDIVSGDFYWLHESATYFYFAVADCTGHGVPGAFMSVLGTNLLTELVQQEPDLDPALLLTRLNFRVREALNQNANREGSQDGMEVALCRYHKGDKTLSFAGANRPLWYYRGGQLIEQPGDKLPIGGTPLPGQTTTFTLHTLQLQMGDTLFAFTDGVQDQFGGEQGRKFSSRRLRELIEQVAALPALDRRIGIQQALEGWQGTTHQTDDILLISVRVS